MADMPPSPRNALLAALAPDALERLQPHLEPVLLPLGKTLYEPGDVLRHVHFPIDAIVSLFCVMESGASAEVSLVGNEGMVGLAVLLDAGRTTGCAMVQSAGQAWRLAAPRLREEFEHHGELQRLMLHYTQSLFTQLAQTAACNRHHTIDQQLCRLLLLWLDRLPGDQLTLTQELIASMLGVRREGGTEAAGKLQRLGVIEYCRGHITVLDRPRLEQLSCECYAVVRREAERLLPGAPGHGAP